MPLFASWSSLVLEGCLSLLEGCGVGVMGMVAVEVEWGLVAAAWEAVGAMAVLAAVMVVGWEMLAWEAG